MQNLKLKKTLSIFILAISFFATFSFAEINKMTINLQGLPTEIKANVLSNITLQDLIERKKKITEKELDDLYHKALQEVLEAVKPYGYYNPKIKSSLDFNNNKKNNSYNYTVNIKVDLGKPILIKEIDFSLEEKSDNTDPSLVNIKLSKYLKVGDTLNQITYEDAKNLILEDILNLGYFRARWKENKIYIDTKHNTCKIVLKLKLGSVYYFNNVEFSKSKIKESLIKKLNPIKSSQRYSANLISQLQSNLRESGYFSHAKINKIVDKASKKIDLKVDLFLNKKNLYAFGAGLNTNEAGRFVLTWNRRYLNKHGSSMRMKAYISPIAQLINAKLLIPGRNPVNEKYNIQAEVDREIINKRILRSGKFGVEQEYHKNDFYKKLALNTIITDTKEIYKNKEIDLSRDSTTFLEFELSDVFVDDFEEPRFGFKYLANMKVGATYLLEKKNKTDESRLYPFSQILFDTKLLLPVNKKNQFIISGRYGATLSNKNKLPDNMLFYGGGDNDLRGYSYKSIGHITTDSKGKQTVVGGNYLLIFSIEHLYRIYDNVDTLLFYDIGTVTNSFQEALKSDIGIGIRWHLYSIGAIKISAALPLSKYKFSNTTLGSGIRLNFSFDTHF